MLAFHTGYAAVRPVDRPLCEPEFSRWWLALLRWREIQSEEGLKSLRARVAERKAIEASDAAIRDALRDEQEEQHSEHEDVASRRSRRRGAKKRRIYDPTNAQDQSSLFRDRDMLLAVLPADDPRAIYLRNGGSLDEYGNPLTRGKYVDRAAPPTPVTVVDPTTGAALTQSVQTTHTLVYPPGYGPAAAQPTEQPSEAPSPTLEALLARDDLPAELREALRATSQKLSSLDGLSGAPALPNLPTL